ncbi:MAG: C69 family dipeptidase [Bacteroidales bacterium]
MCDTFVATPDCTENQKMIFGKNSDREPNEAQAIIRIPAGERSEKTVRCTYISIPQAKYTYEVILSKPFWMWGAEMGINEHGLALGNEAVFTKIKIPNLDKPKPSRVSIKDNGLSGMDLLRLALERTDTSEKAIELITNLLQTYGQDANGGYTKKFYYHNSFIIADPKNAWVLETVDKHWVAKKINIYYPISNRLTIGSDYDLSSDGLEDFAVQHKLLKRGNKLNFRKAFSDRFYTYMSKSKMRHRALLNSAPPSGEFKLNHAIDLLTSHYKNDHFSPRKNYGGGSVCMHANGFPNPMHTAGSMIAEIGNNRNTIWLTGTSNPCLSVYKPFFFRHKTLETSYFKEPGKTADDSLWWRAERFHRKVMANYQIRRQQFHDDRISLQKDIIHELKALMRENSSSKALEEFSEKTLNTHFEKISEWEDLVNKTSFGNRLHFLYRNYWKKLNKKAGIQL